ncbi:MAG: hypothetical protein K2H64_09150 [Desulfovibrio sp.]|nr:hypothetical protein [Desulfovibrio sp.]
MKKYPPANNLLIGHKTGASDKNSRGEIIGANDCGFVILSPSYWYVSAVFIKNSRAPLEECEEMIA